MPGLSKNAIVALECVLQIVQARLRYKEALYAEWQNPSIEQLKTMIVNISPDVIKALEIDSTGDVARLMQIRMQEAISSSIRSLQELLNLINRYDSDGGVELELVIALNGRIEREQYRLRIQGAQLDNEFMRINCEYFTFKDILQICNNASLFSVRAQEFVSTYTKYMPVRTYRCCIQLTAQFERLMNKNLKTILDMITTTKYLLGSDNEFSEEVKAKINIIEGSLQNEIKKLKYCQNIYNTQTEVNEATHNNSIKTAYMYVYDLKERIQELSQQLTEIKKEYNISKAKQLQLQKEQQIAEKKQTKPTKNQQQRAVKLQASVEEIKPKAALEKVRQEQKRKDEEKLKAEKEQEEKRKHEEKLKAEKEQEEKRKHEEKLKAEKEQEEKRKHDTHLALVKWKEGVEANKVKKNEAKRSEQAKFCDFAKNRNLSTDEQGILKSKFKISNEVLSINKTEIEEVLSADCKSISYKKAVALIKRLGGKIDVSTGSSHQKVIFNDCVYQYLENEELVTQQKLVTGLPRPHNGETELKRFELGLLKDVIRSIIPEQPCIELETEYFKRSFTPG